VPGVWLAGIGDPSVSATVVVRARVRDTGVVLGRAAVNCATVKRAGIGGARVRVRVKWSI